MPYEHSPTKFGWIPAAEAFRPERLHLFGGEPLRVADHEPPVPVLDQENLLAQGIRTDELVPGAPSVDALGSCTAQSGTVSIAERVHTATGKLPPGLTGDPVADERWAILLYHATTWQTGDPASEWPPADCGSNGAYTATELERQGLAAGYKTASTVTDIVSMLQGGTAIVGSPWFRGWMEPDSRGFVDGDGTYDDLMWSAETGVAGGHERCITAVEHLEFDSTGAIDPFRSWVRERNSWGSGWADHGSHRIRLSTYQMLGRYLDVKQFTLKETS